MAGPTLRKRPSRAARVTDARAIRVALDAVGRLYDRSLDSVLATPHHVAGRADARSLLAEASRPIDAVGDQVTRVALVATPVLRRLRRLGPLGRLPGVRRLPLVLSATTVASVAAGLAHGVRDVQVIGSYVANRIEETSGLPADPDLVKRLTVQLYLSPRSTPDLRRRATASGLLRRWTTQGVLGRDGRRSAHKTIDAVHRLDIGRVLGEWRTISADVSSAHRSDPTPCRGWS